jgi:muramoyltetrapeptide carboxypeptidase
MTAPPSLKTGDAVALISPAKALEKGAVDYAISVFKDRGLHPVVGRNALGRHRAFAATEQQRLHDLNEAIRNPDIKAVFCNRGGYGAMHLLNGVDIASIISQPKWLVGYSDITALHLLWQSEGICSLHGAMPRDFSDHPDRLKSYTALLDLLMGVPYPAITWQTSAKEGTFEGLLTGGNLSLLAALLPGVFDAPEVPYVLFVEEISEELYHIDRMLMSLWLSGSLGACQCILAGQFTSCKDSTGWFDGGLQQLFEEFEKRTDIPVISGFPAGHEAINTPLILGRKVRVTSIQHSCTIQSVAD